MITSVQTHTDAEGLVVQAIRLINYIYTMEGDLSLVVGPELKIISVRSIRATEQECTVILYNVSTQMDVAEFTVTDYHMPSWHDIHEKIEISI